MATTKKSTCVSTTIRGELIERLVRSFKAPRRREDVEPDDGGANFSIGGEAIDRRLGRRQAAWWPSTPEVAELAKMPVGTWVVPDGFNKTRCCRTKQEAMGVLKTTLLKLGSWGDASVWRISSVENPEYGTEAYVEVIEFTCCFGDEEGRYPDSAYWLPTRRLSL